MRVNTLISTLLLIEDIEVRENNMFLFTTTTTSMPEEYLNRDINNMFYDKSKGRLVIDLEVKE